MQRADCFLLPNNRFNVCPILLREVCPKREKKTNHPSNMLNAVNFRKRVRVFHAQHTLLEISESITLFVRGPWAGWSTEAKLPLSMRWGRPFKRTQNTKLNKIALLSKKKIKIYHNTQVRQIKLTCLTANLNCQFPVSLGSIFLYSPAL